MDKATYGKSKAEIYLSDVLDKSNISKQSKYVGKLLSELSKTLNDIDNCKTKSYLLNILKTDRLKAVDNSISITDEKVRSILRCVVNSKINKFRIK